MWVYQEQATDRPLYTTDRFLYTVGFYSPDGEWHTDCNYSDREKAATRVHYLNGGWPSTADVDAVAQVHGEKAIPYN